MTSIWKKLRKHNSKDIDDPSKTSDQSIQSCLVQKADKKCLVCSQDEDLYFQQTNSGLKNPIDAKSQIVQNLDDAFCFTDSNFVSFLESEGAHSIWYFFENCQQYECNFSQFESKELPEAVQASAAKSGEEAQMVLPDLVSNIIPKDAKASPMSSPEKKLGEEETLEESVCQSTTEDLTQCQRNYVSNQSSEQKSDTKACEDTVIYDTALNIFNSYIRPGCDHMVPLSISTQKDIASKVKENIFHPELFHTAKEEIYKILNQKYFTKYVNSQYYLKHKVDLLTSTNVKLPDIIHCDNTLPFFMEFMEMEEKSLLLEFWISLSNFRQHLLSLEKEGIYDKEQAQEDAMILYDKYFSMQATSPMGFSHTIRFMVESSICQEKGLDARCFDVPLGIVFLILERDYFKQYISSSFHIRCLTELIHSTQDNVKKHRRTVSETTSISSTSEKMSDVTSPNKCTNTLLAMDTSKAIKAFEDNLSMRIDSKQILEPESLWRRKKFKRLSCGYIDRLGRFESELLPDPFKQESRLTKLKKLINSEENKLKEEMAYQVAEMIIKDVLNMTINK